MKDSLFHRVAGVLLLTAGMLMLSPDGANGAGRDVPYRLEHVVLDGSTWPQARFIIAPWPAPGCDASRRGDPYAFQVNEGNVLDRYAPEKVEVFEGTGLPAVLVLIVNTSMSMSVYWGDLRPALVKFAAGLDARLPSSVLRVVTYAETAKVHDEHLPSKWTSAFGNIEPSSQFGAQFTEALCKAADLVVSLPSETRRAVLILSDGLDDDVAAKKRAQCEAHLKAETEAIYVASFSPSGWDIPVLRNAEPQLRALAGAAGFYNRIEVPPDGSAPAFQCAFKAWEDAIAESVVLAYNLRMAVPGDTRLSLWYRARMLPKMVSVRTERPELETIFSLSLVARVAGFLLLSAAAVFQGFKTWRSLQGPRE